MYYIKELATTNFICSLRNSRVYGEGNGFVIITTYFCVDVVLYSRWCFTFNSKAQQLLHYKIALGVIVGDIGFGLTIF